MKIRMLTTMAGPEGVFLPGQIVDLENGEELVAGGYAVSMEPEKKPEPKKKKK